MALEITFDKPINVSAQVGDIVYFTPVTINGVHNTAGVIIELGNILKYFLP